MCAAGFKINGMEIMRVGSGRGVEKACLSIEKKKKNKNI